MFQLTFWRSGAADIDRRVHLEKDFQVGQQFFKKEGIMFFVRLKMPLLCYSGLTAI